VSVTVFGADFSVYTRSVRMALLEADIDHSLETVDPFDGDVRAHLKRHPFGKIPALVWDDFTLYETPAILRYVAARSAAPLVPGDVEARARMDQILSILDSYGFRAMVWDVYVEGVQKDADGEALDGDIVTRGLRETRRVLRGIADLAGPAPYLAGGGLSLADLHFVSMASYLRVSSAGRSIFDATERLADWWRVMATRDSVIATRYPAEAEH
jgi:glutathione S-transferase